MNINKEEILFAILAGGVSKRFGGGFKTLSKINGVSILSKIISILKIYSQDIIINTNNVTDEFKKYEIPIVKDKLEGYLGPLAGIHTSILQARKKYQNKNWVFTVPSDTPFLPEDLINKFLNSNELNTKIFIARSNNRHHPVVAMWHVSLLESLENEIKSKNYKIMKWVEKHKYKFVDFEKNYEDNFFNINTKDDLITAIKIQLNKKDYL